MAATLLRVSKWANCFLLFSLTACGQGVECNNEAIFKRDQKEVPKEVCIPKGYVISYVYSRHKSIDFNVDGRPDYVFAIEKKIKTIGDSTYLFFFKRNSDSTYTYIRKFGNVYPIYFNPNDEHPLLKEGLQQETFDCYLMPDPLYALEIESDSLIITRKLDNHDLKKRRYVFRYNSSLSNWSMISAINYTQDQSEIFKVKTLKLLSDFSYCEN